MNAIPTAEEFSKNYSRLRSAVALKDLSDFAIEFAKLHCEAQAKAIVEKVKMKDVYFIDAQNEFKHQVVDKDSILNAYPLTKIL